MVFEGFDASLYDTLTVGEGHELSFRVKGSTQDGDGKTHPHEVVMRGFVEEYDEGEWKNDGEGVPLKLKLSLRYYERHIDGAEVWAVDPAGMVLRQNGADLLAEHRTNIGR